MAEEGLVKPVVYDKPYSGLEDVARVFEDMGARRVWGRAVVDVLGAEKGHSARPKM
jgi:hypothetical protein